MCDCGSRIHVKTGKKDISGAREKCSSVHGVTKSRTQLKRLSMKVSDCHHGLQNPCWVKREMRRLGGKRDSGEGQ